jgi:hypothetical protein
VNNKLNLIILFLLVAQQQQWTPTLTEASSINSNFGQSQIGQGNQQQSIYIFYRLINQIFFIYLDFPQQNQVLGSQQWLSKLFRQSLFKVILSI